MSDNMKDQLRLFPARIVSSTLVAAVSLLAACSDDTAVSSGGASGAGGTGSGTGGMAGMGGVGGADVGGMGGAGGGGASINGVCDPSSPEFVLGLQEELPAECSGVFVKGGVSGGDGSRGSPFGDLSEALLHADGVTPVYVCSEVTVPSAAVINKDVTIIGGFDCSWRRDEIPAPLTSAVENEPVLTVSGANTEVHLVEIAVAAADAQTPGTSSIGVVVDASSLALYRSSIKSGAGAPGEAGLTPAGNGTPGLPGANGGTGCVTAVAGGGAGGDFACEGVPTFGGIGGSGTSGAMGQAGSPGSAGAPGGAGQVQFSTPSVPGTPGATGGEGTPGTLGLPIGLLSISGYTPPSANDDATPGLHGDGGGGGGGASECPANGALSGPGGGGGGAGGCGGLPGGGGKGGGASFALVLFDQAAVSFIQSTLASGNGGVGGAGGNGQYGGVGGEPGISGPNVGTAIAEDGGPGGYGGRGGPGAGGAGGPSALIALGLGATAPVLDGVGTQLGAAGNGGAGGDNDSPNNDAPDGQAGLGCVALEFAANGASCLQ